MPPATPSPSAPSADPTSPAAPAAPKPSPVQRLVGRPWFWFALVATLMAFPIVRAVRARPPELPAVVTPVPAFTLTDQLGRPFSSEALRGKVWVANFIFSRCPTICPRFSEKMAEVGRRSRGLGDMLHRVSFTVDPEHDTPEKLLAYAQKYEASPQSWSFLTGSRAALEDVILRGLKVHMSRGEDADDIMSIGHGGHFVLVDAELQVRGYYDSADADAVDRLVRDAGRLANVAASKR